MLGETMKKEIQAIYTEIASKLNVFEALKQSGLDGIWIQDLKDEVVPIYVDPSFAKRLGLAESETNFEIIKKQIHPRCAPKLMSFLAQETDQKRNPEPPLFCFSHLNGSELWFHFNPLLIHDENQIPLLKIFLIKDISLLKKQEIEFQNKTQRLEKFTSMLANSGDLIFILDDEFKFIEYFAKDNSQLYFTPDEFIGKKISELAFPEPIGNLFIQALNSIRDTGTNQEVEYALTVNQQLNYYLLQGSKHQSDFTGHFEYLLVVKNVTKQKQSEIEHQKQFEKQQVLLRSISDLKFIFDKNGNFLDVIATDENSLMAPKEQIIGKNLSDFFTPELTNLFYDKFKTCFEAKQPETIEYYIHFKGEKQLFEARLFPLTTTNEILALVRNITSERQLEERIRRDHELLHNLSNQLSGAFYVFEQSKDGDFRFDYVSNRFKEMFPLAIIGPSEDTTRTLFPHTHPEDQLKLQKAILKSKNELSAFKVELRVTNPYDETEIRWVKASSQPEINSEGTTIWHGYIEDITDEKLNERHLQETTDFLNSISNSIPGIVMRYRLYPDGRDAIEYISKGVESLYEIKLDDVLQNSQVMWSPIHPEDVTYLRDSIEESAKKLTHWTCNYRIITKSGVLKWLHANGEPKLLRDQSIIWHTIVVDVTEEKLNEFRIQQLSNLLSKSEELTHSGSWEINFQKQTVTWSDSLYALTGIPNTTEIKFDGMNQFIHPDDIAKAEKAFLHAMENNTVYEMEHRVKTKQNRLIPCRSYGVFERDSNGALIRCIGIIQDLSEFKEKEKELEGSEIRYRNLFENNPQPMWIYDIETLQFLEVNQAAVQHYGYTKEEFKTMTILDVRPDEDIPRFIKNYLSKNLPFTRLEQHNKHVKKDGTTIYVTTSMQDFELNGKRVRHEMVNDITKLLEKERQIKTLHNEIERVFNGTQDALVLVEYFPDGQFRFRRTNRIFEIMTGKKEDQLKYRTPQEVFSDKDAETRINRYHYAIENNRSYQFIESFEINGRTHLWKTTLNPFVTIESGVYIVESSVDITHQIEVESNLAKNIKRLELALEAGHFGTWDWNVITNETTYNETWATMLGYSLDEIESNANSFYELVHPDDRSRIDTEIQSALHNPEKNHFHFEVRMKAKNGDWKWILDSSKVIERDENGKALFLIGVHQDITERKTQELNLLRTTTLLEQTNTTAQVGGWEVDFENEKIFWSSLVHERIFEIDEHILSNLTFEESLSKRANFYEEGVHRNRFIEVNTNLIESGKAYDEEFKILTSKGNKKWVRVIGKPLLDNNRVIKIYGSIMDITEQKLNLEKLHELMELTHFQNKKLKEYTYLTSHNLRSPIVNLISLCSMYKEDPENDAYLDMIEQSAHKLNDTMKVMHDILLIEQGKESEVKQAIHLKTVVEHIAELLNHQIEHPDIEFSNECDELHYVFGIPAYVESILNNFITNAIKYRKESSKTVIKVQSRLHSTHLLAISVIDNGLGIDLKMAEHKLFKLHNRFHKHIEGKGIGLFYSKAQADAMGGFIEVESEPNQGATFTLFIPQVTLNSN